MCSEYHTLLLLFFHSILLDLLWLRSLSSSRLVASCKLQIGQITKQPVANKTSESRYREKVRNQLVPPLSWWPATLISSLVRWASKLFSCQLAHNSALFSISTTANSKPISGNFVLHFLRKILSRKMRLWARFALILHSLCIISSWQSVGIFS